MAKKTIPNINILTEKPVLHDDDLFIIEDSENGYIKKKVKKSNIGGDVDLSSINRELANIEAVFDIDGKAIQNSGKFYDLFDDTNTYSQGKLDTAKTTLFSDVDATDTILPVDDASEFSVGEEITLQGDHEIIEFTPFALTDASDDSAITYAAASGTRNILFGNNNTKVYMYSLSTGLVEQYSISDADDISTVTSDSKSLDVSTQFTNGYVTTFNADGTKLFAVDFVTTATVHMYTLGTAWDISTATHTFTIDMASIDGTPSITYLKDLHFSQDGTKCFIMDINVKTLYSFDLSSAWDLSTASYVTSWLATGQDSSPTQFIFNADGTILILGGSASDSLYEYSLGTAYDLSDITYSSISFSFPAGSWYGLSFRPDGEKCYYIVSPTYDVTQSSLGSILTSRSDIEIERHIISSISSNNITVSAITNAYASGSYVYRSLVDQGTSNELKFGGLIGYDISIASYDNKSYTETEEEFPRGVVFNSDGTKMYVLGYDDDTVYQYILGTAWDVSTANYADKFKSVNAQEGSSTSIAFNDDGTKMYIVGYGNNYVYQYTLGTAWDVSTANYADKSHNVGTQDSNSYSMCFGSDGAKFYIAGGTGNKVYQYDLSTAWDVSTASYNSKFYQVTSQENSIRTVAFDNTGENMFIIGYTNQTVYQYILSTAWDVSTADYSSNSLPVTTQTDNAIGMVFSVTGHKLYIIDGSDDTIYQYFTGTGFNVTIVDIRYNITPVDTTSEVAFWVQRDKLTGFSTDAAVSIVDTAADESYEDLTPTVTNLDVDSEEDAYTHSVETAEEKVTVRITMIRASTDDDVKLDKILGAID